MKRYNPKEIEPKWQQTWEETKVHEAEDGSDKPKKYILEYFPYPSGAAMHVGHVRNYTIGDALTRHARMNGYNVMHPMGWDAFGLPAENYAIKTGTSPQQAVAQNVERFKRQLTQMGFGYDWSREINSTDPGYYKWTQWFFLLLFKRGLAYQKESLQWWCPVDKTVLANEQVENGQCWRCGSQVEKKALNQWFFKITEYADRLAKDLDDVNWSHALKTMQRNWIGHKTGIDITYKISNAHPEGAADFTAKQDLEFIPKWIDKVTSGQKNLTFRLEDQHLAEGDYFRLVNWETKEPFGFARVDSVDKKQLKDIPLDHPGQEKYESEDERRQKWSEYHHAEVTDESTFWMYRYTFVAPAITCFTTRPDTNFGATFVVLAPEHPFVEKVMKQQIVPGDGPSHWQAVEHYVQKSLNKSELERQEEGRLKTGAFTGFYVKNELTGKDMPVWVSDFVLMGFGTGAVVGVPGHDKRDFQFAKQFDIPVERVVAGPDGDDSPITEESQVQEEAGTMVNSDFLNGLPINEATEKIKDYMEEKGMGIRKHSYRIRDWLISRQRYWGAPIPIIHCEKDGAVAVPDDQLPVVLPEVESYEPKTARGAVLSASSEASSEEQSAASNYAPAGDGRSPLARVPEFVNTTCPKCGRTAQRETDTMDGFACSSWYFLRFADPHNDEHAFDPEKIKYWLPVDDYIGGAEHAVMHLLYARFWVKVMQDEGLIDFGEPFKTLRNHGMILAPDGAKMSKSKGNTIEPDGLIEQGYGADAIRIMELFIGPWNQAANWSVEGMGGAHRFLQRIWTLTQEYIEQKDASGQPGADDAELKRVMHSAIYRVSKDLEELGFNTAIATLMETVNELYKRKAAQPAAGDTWKWALETLLQLLAPFAPHITEELWHQIGRTDSIHTSEWPKYDEQYLARDTMTIVVQVNGKVRAQLELPADATEEQAVAAAKADEKVASYLKGKEAKKTIYIPKKLVSLVV